jgi:hypothetical protein
MQAHNDPIYYVDELGRRQRRRRNDCPHCRWFEADWAKWPRFQGTS